MERWTLFVEDWRGGGEVERLRSWMRVRLRFERWRGGDSVSDGVQVRGGYGVKDLSSF